MSDGHGQVDLVPNPSDTPAPGNTVNLLWLILVSTLSGVIVISLIGSIVLVALKLNAALIIGVGSAALTGLLGLFVSPSSSSSSSNKVG